MRLTAQPNEIQKNEKLNILGKHRETAATGTVDLPDRSTVRYEAWFDFTEEPCTTFIRFQEEKEREVLTDRPIAYERKNELAKGKITQKKVTFYFNKIYKVFKLF
jgi:hypothetical protein